MRTGYFPGFVVAAIVAGDVALSLGESNPVATHLKNGVNMLSLLQLGPQVHRTSEIRGGVDCNCLGNRQEECPEANDQDGTEDCTKQYSTLCEGAVGGGTDTQYCYDDPNYECNGSGYEGCQSKPGKICRDAKVSEGETECTDSPVGG